MIHREIIRFRSGVYKIENLITGSVYVGASKNIYNRYHTHKCKLKKNIHPCRALNNEYLSLGGDNFLLTVLEYCEINQLSFLENHYCVALAPFYNKRVLNVETNLGLEIAASRRQAISNTLKEKNKLLRDAGLPTLNPKNEDKWIPVDAFNEFGVKIGSYPSFTEAARVLYDRPRYSSHVSKICKGEVLSLKGLRFRLKSNNIECLEKYVKHRRPV